jgi:predicted methyltransferase
MAARMRSLVSSLIFTLGLTAACTRHPLPTKPSDPALAPPPPPPAPVAAAPVATSAPAGGNFDAVVEAPDRDPEDRKLDASRHPAELLATIGVAQNARVAEIGAGGGYTAELLARAVGPGGVVYGVNSKVILDRFAEKPWSARLAKPVMKNVVRLDRDFDDPFPAEVRDLDAVTIVLFYHDMVWMKVDRDRMNKAVFDALKPGGVYLVADHSSREGAGLTEVETLHRIEEKVLRAEVERAGFRLVAEASFLRNPADTRDWNDSPRVAGERRGQSDRFVLKFEKPR